MELFIIIIINWTLTNIDETHYLTFDKKCTMCAQKNSIIPDISNYMQFVLLTNLSKSCFHTFKYKLFILISKIRCLCEHFRMKLQLKTLHTMHTLKDIII